MSSDFTLVLSESAVASLAHTAGSTALLDEVGRRVRDSARTNARSITAKVAAIVTERGQDDLGPFIDVGYSKHHPGFFLWWWEVGTRRHGPRAHLRPALRPNLI